MNGKGQATGIIVGPGDGAVWDDANTVTVLDGSPSAINSAGTLVVGTRSSDQVPAYWYRTTSGAWKPAGVALPSLGSAGGNCRGQASDVNDDGVVVGKSCDGGGNLQATVWRLDLSGAVPVLVAGPQRLPGLGAKPTRTNSETSAARRISNTAPYVISGYATDPGAGRDNAIVRWRTW